MDPNAVAHLKPAEPVVDSMFLTRLMEQVWNMDELSVDGGFTTIENPPHIRQVKFTGRDFDGQLYSVDLCVRRH